MSQTRCVEHIVVLMLENRSFDHMLGWSFGLSVDESNWLDPANPGGGKVVVNRDAEFSDPTTDPGHEFVDVALQLDSPSPNGPNNGGFVASYARRVAEKGGSSADAKAIMRCFDPKKLPVLTRLSTQFSVCTRWHSSVPGPTWPNRFFAHAAQSDGCISGKSIDVPTIFESLAGAGRSSRIYFHDIPQALAIRSLWRLMLNEQHLFSFRRFHHFEEDVRSGDLADYTFIEPQYFELGDFDFSKWYMKLVKPILALYYKGTKASDQHPPHDIRMGERLIKRVYETLANSDRGYWRNTMLLVLYDEHGGLYDHIAAPADAIDPCPQGPHEGDFRFDRLGVRVPAVVVSPYVKPGSSIDVVLDHSSICATLRRVFSLPDSLTERDKVANTIDAACGEEAAGSRWPALPSLRVNPLTRASKRTPSDLQVSLHQLATEVATSRQLTEYRPQAAPVQAPLVPTTESEAGSYVRQVMGTLFD